MSWFIHKSDDLVRARPIELDLHHTFSPNPTNMELRMRQPLLASRLNTALKHPQADMETVCTLKCDLSVVPKELFEKQSRTDDYGNKAAWSELLFKLVQTISSGPMQFSLKCWQGVRWCLSGLLRLDQKCVAYVQRIEELGDFGLGERLANGIEYRVCICMLILRRYRSLFEVVVTHGCEMSANANLFQYC